MLNEPLPALATGDRRLSLVGSRYYLVEFSLGVVPEFARTVLEQIARAGVVPLVAHPERYDACSSAVIRTWRDAGAKALVDAGTLTRPGVRGSRARELLKSGLADAVASDNHGDGRSMLRAVCFLRERVDGPSSLVDRVTALLTVDNPRAVVEDREMVDVPRVQFKEGLIDKLRRVIEG
jgi:protein-tyrosine phosphatase